MKRKIFNTSLLVFTFIFNLSISSCYQLFQSKIPMSQDKPGKTLDSVIEDKISISQLSAPSQIFVSQGLLKDTIKIHWSAVDGAASYRLERAIKHVSDTSEPDESDYKVIKASGSSLVSSSFISGTEYTDLVITNPTFASTEYDNIYYYRVQAENVPQGYESSLFTVSEKAYLFAPTKNIHASAGESSDEVTVSWDKVPKATQYRIFRSGDATNSNPVELKTVSGDVLKYTNVIGTSEQGVDFYYTVEAINSNLNTSVKSAVAMGFALKEGAPGRVADVKITPNKGRGDGPATNGIEISWKAQEGLMYTVYRSSTKDSSLTQIATGLKTNSVIDKKSLKPNTYYYYYVLGYKIMGIGDSAELVKGPLSKTGPEDETPAEGFIMSPPSETEISRIGNKFQIKFTQPIGEEGYLEDSGIYTEESDYKTFKYKILGGNAIDSIDNIVDFDEVYPVAGYYTVTVDGTYKFYKIITTNEDGSKESVASSVVAPSPSAAKNVLATKAAYFNDESIMKIERDGNKNNMITTGANNNGVFPVKITWESPKDGADGGYHIYRSTMADSNYRRITETPVTGLEFIDYNDTAKAGTFYYYKVLALNSLGNGSNFSDYDMGYGALTYNQYMREYNKTILRSQKKLTYRNKPGTTEKLGTETINGDTQGTLYYSANIAGLGARIIMLYTDYIDYLVSYSNNGTEISIPIFHLDGNTNTSAQMDSSGTMDGIVTNAEDGMYPGTVDYNNVKIVGGNAGGGYYTITPKGFPAGLVDYKIGLEGW